MSDENGKDVFGRPIVQGEWLSNSIVVFDGLRDVMSRIHTAIVTGRPAEILDELEIFSKGVKILFDLAKSWQAEIVLTEQPEEKPKPSPFVKMIDEMQKMIKVTSAGMATEAAIEAAMNKALAVDKVLGNIKDKKP